MIFEGLNMSTSQANSATPPPVTSPSPSSRFGVTSASASTQADPFYRGRLNLHAGDLQEDVARRVEEFNAMTTIFIGGQRHDIRANGMLSDIVASTPVLIYDLPELKMRVNTAFVDTTGRMYICDTFYRKLIKEQDEGKDSLFFLLRHEADHLRRLHLQRMMDVDPDIANESQDIRINIDIITMAVGNIMAARSPDGKVVYGPAFDDEVRAYISNIGESLKGGCGLTFEAYKKYHGWSEERIAADLMKNRPPAPPQDAKQTEISFSELMEGAAQDCDQLASLGKASGNTMPNTMPTQTGNTAPDISVATLNSTLAKELRAIGVARGKVNLQTMRDCMASLLAVMDTEEMTDRDLQHSRLQLTPGKVVPSVKTKDTYVNDLTPRERLMLAAKLINMVLNPKSGASAGASKGGLKVKDMDAMLGKGSGQGDPAAGDPSGNEGTPDANVKHGGDHVMTAKEMADILNRNGLKETAAKLGYDDLKTIGREEEAAKQSVVAAINQASEDMMRVGLSRMPGGHMVDYAVARLNDFYKPVLTLKMAIKETIEGCGRSIRYEEEEPWQPFYVDHEDMGLSCADDIPYQGSYVSGATKKPVVITMIDSSGSVDDSMLKRFGTESVNFAKESQGENAPEVIIVFADTVARGKPIFIDENNVDEYLSNGLGYGGRGGTSFQASIENVFEMFRPDSGSPFEGRKLDALIYFTDSFDVVPDQARLEEKAFECGFDRLPTSLFLVPQSCYNEPFAKGTADWATTIFFNPKRELSGPGCNPNEIDVEAIEEELAAKGKRANKIA